MSTPLFKGWIGAGGGEIAALYHIAGLPWAATTHQSVIDALSNRANADVQAYLEELFGDATLNSITPAHLVQITPTLSAKLGKQDLKFDDGKGVSGGDWAVSLSRGDNGLTYDYRTDNTAGSTPPGIYAGLELMEDTLYDATIVRATLAANYDPQTDTTIEFGGEGAVELAALIDANDADSKLTYLWAGTCCVAVYKQDTQGDHYQAEVVPGVWRSPWQRLMMSVAEGGTTLLANAPHAGAVGANGVLWLIRLDASGAIVDIATASTTGRPVMFRCGPISNNPTFEVDEIRVQHKHWLGWLDASVPKAEITGRLKGYRFCRQSQLMTDMFGQIQMPHLVFYEWNSVGGAYQEVQIWLHDEDGNEIAAGESISFDDIEDLCTAALASMDFDGGLANTYQGEVGKLEIVDAVDNHTYWVTGPVAWVLGWGMASPTDMAHLTTHNDDGAYDWQWYSSPARQGWAPVLDPSWVIDDYVMPAFNAPGRYRNIRPSSPYSYSYAFVPQFYFLELPPADYYYGWNWTVDGAAAIGWNPILAQPLIADDLPVDDWGNPVTFPPEYGVRRVVCKMRPIIMDAGADPGTPDPGDYRLKFDDDTTPDDLIQGDKLTLGHEEVHANNPVAAPYAVEVFTEIASSGYDYLVPVVVAPNVWDGTVVPVFRVGYSDDWITRWGSALCAWPLSSDPWAPRLESDVSSETLTELMMGILYADGTNTGSYTPASVPAKRQLSWVPDAFGGDGETWGGVSNFRRLVDWRKLEIYSGTTWTSATWALQTGSKINVMEALTACLLTHGVRPIWEYSESQRAWWLTFRPTGVISQAYAQQRGRVITDAHVTAAKEVREVWGNTWLYNGARLLCNYAGDDAGIDLSVTIETGRAVIAAGAETLKIDDPLTQLPATLYTADLATLLARLYSLTYRYAIAYPTTEIETTIAALTDVGCGSEISLTSDLAYNPYTAARGVEKIGAMITQCGVDITDKRAAISLTLRVAPFGQVGISPSLDLASTDYTRVTTTITVTGYSILATANNYADPAGGLTDLQTFGQFIYDESTGEVAYESQGDTDGQRVRVITANAEAYYYTGAGQNVWLGTLKGSATDLLTYADAVANGDFRIVLDSANNFPGSPVDVVVIYAPRDDASIQPSQHVFGWLGDESGKIYDSASTPYRAMAWS